MTNSRPLKQIIWTNSVGRSKSTNWAPADEVPEVESTRGGKYQRWKEPEVESTRDGKYQRWTGRRTPLKHILSQITTVYGPLFIVMSLVRSADDTENSDTEQSLNDEFTRLLNRPTQISQQAIHRLFQHLWITQAHMEPPEVFKEASINQTPWGGSSF